jgi:hypothetical protein
MSNDPATDEARADLALLARELMAPLIPQLQAVADALVTPPPVAVAPSDYWHVVTAYAATDPRVVLPADLLRFRVTAFNTGTSVVYLGPDPANMVGNVPGLRLNPGASLSIDTRAAISAVAPAGPVELQLVVEFRKARS